MVSAVWILALVGCHGEDPGAQALGVQAIVDPTRAEHYFDVPFPSDELLTAQGTADLTGYPEASTDLARDLLNSWVDRIELTSVGFGVNTAAYMRFNGAITVPESTQGLPSDPVLWVALDGSGELLPLDLRFVEDPLNDPFYGPNTLASAPTLGHPPRAGVTYAAVVTEAVGASAPSGFSPSPELQEALAVAGVTAPVAVATQFTVQDTTGQLRALAQDVEGHLGDWSGVSYRRAISLRYEQGKTERGLDSTLAITTFEDGSTRTAYLEASEGAPAHTTDLTEDWPMFVYEADLPVWNYQGLAERPYMSPGLLHINDMEVQTGWIDFEGDTLRSTPEPEQMRVVVQIPKDAQGEPLLDTPVVLFDHGTSGHAYNIVQRRSVEDNGLALATRFAEAGFMVISRDAPLYGVRYPLIDEGYGGSLGFYNIVNVPAFRDNQRQTAVDGFVLRRYIDQALNDQLPVGRADPTHVRRMGHSLGSVTSNLGLAMSPEDYDRALLSGTGGVFLNYYFDTGLLQDMDPASLNLLFPLLGIAAPAELTTQNILGAVLGLEEAAWPQVDRLHPATALFQWQMDPSDPMAVAPDEAVPVTAVIAQGDWQTPAYTAEALVVALPEAEAVPCEALGDYDPHYCMWREQQGFDALEAWLALP